MNLAFREKKKKIPKKKVTKSKIPEREKQGVSLGRAGKKIK